MTSIFFNLLSLPLQANNKQVIWDFKDSLSSSDYDLYDQLLRSYKNEMGSEELCEGISFNLRKCIQRLNPFTIEAWEVKEVCRNAKFINKLGPQLPYLGGMLTARNLYDTADFLLEYYVDVFESDAKGSLNKDEIQNFIKQFKLIELAKVECPEEMTNP